MGRAVGGGPSGGETTCALPPAPPGQHTHTTPLATLATLTALLTPWLSLSSVLFGKVVNSLRALFKKSYKKQGMKVPNKITNGETLYVNSILEHLKNANVDVNSKHFLAFRANPDAPESAESVLCKRDAPSDAAGLRTSPQGKVPRYAEVRDSESDESESDVSSSSEKDVPQSPSRQPLLSPPDDAPGGSRDQPYCVEEE